MVGALKEREAALLTVQSIDEDLDRRRRAVEQLEETGSRRAGGDPAIARRVAGMQNALASLEAALEAAKAEYERVKSRNREVRRCLAWFCAHSCCSARLRHHRSLACAHP